METQDVTIRRPYGATTSTVALAVSALAIAVWLLLPLVQGDYRGASVTSLISLTLLAGCSTVFGVALLLYVFQDWRVDSVGVVSSPVPWLRIEWARLRAARLNVRSRSEGDVVVLRLESTSRLSSRSISLSSGTPTGGLRSPDASLPLVQKVVLNAPVETIGLDLALLAILLATSSELTCETQSVHVSQAAEETLALHLRAARDSVRAGLDARTEDDHALKLLGSLLWYLDDSLTSAISYAEDVVGSGPEDFRCLFVIAAARAKMGDVQEAAATFLKVSRLAPPPYAEIARAQSRIAATPQVAEA